MEVYKTLAIHIRIHYRIKGKRRQVDDRMVEHVDLWFAECGNVGAQVGVFFELVDGWVD
jgi:hypothetical protein